MTQPASKSIVRSSTMGAGLSALGFIRGIIIIPLMIRYLGEKDYGLYVLVVTAVSYVLIPALLGLDTAIYRYLPANLGTSRQRETFSAVLRLASINLTILVLVTAGAVLIFPLTQQIRLFIALGVVICIFQTLVSIGASYYRAEGKLHIFFAIATLRVLLGLISVLIGTVVLNSVEAIIISLAIGTMLMVPAVLVPLYRRVGLAPSCKEERSNLLNFGAHSVVNGLLMNFFFFADKYWIGLWSGVENLAYYTPAFALANILALISAIGLTSVPHLLADSYDKGDIGGLRHVMDTGLHIFSIIVIPAMVGIVIVAKPLLVVLTTQQLADKGYIITVILSAAMLGVGYGRFFSQLVRVHGLSAWANMQAAVMVVVYLAYVLVGTFMGANVVVVVATGFLFISLVHVAILFRKTYTLIGAPMRIGNFLVPAAGSLIIVVPATMLDLSNSLHLAVEIIAGAGAYFALLYFLGGTRTKDILRLLVNARGKDNAG